MMRQGLDEGAWAKSSYSGATDNNCLEWRRPAEGGVAVRDSKNPQGGAFTFTAAAWTAFVAAAKAGEFERLAG
ncbi:DUF397 domain-containing protein [Streptomyces pathocidini]|uniref:DUF397 domain-containing protein n=1 Tax=Streptomyces pathocidini TaxID=1650571 RepID=UPI0033EED5E9